MSELANHMRITGLHVTDQDVDTRKAAIAVLKTTWNKNLSYDFVFAKACDIASALSGDGTPSEALGKSVEATIQKKASAFLYVERPLEVGIVAGMVVKEILAVPAQPQTLGWTWTDVWAAALWLALGFQPSLADEKREALRMSVLKAARDRSIEGADKGRQRMVVPDFGKISLTAGEEEKLGDTVKQATSATIEALRRNSALDREEMDFLWWTQLRRSRLLNRPLDVIEEITRVIATGIEGAAYLRRMPSEVHREIVLRTIDANPSFSLAGVLTALGADREALATHYVGKLPAGGAILFPLLTAINTGRVDDTPASKMERNAEEWGTRALLEAALLKMQVSGPGAL
ncbi:MAG: GTPase-associated system all-helical protein GASH [Verrucomicrobiota bacterium]